MFWMVCCDLIFPKKINLSMVSVSEMSEHASSGFYIAGTT